MSQLVSELRDAVFASPILIVDDSPINCVILEKMLRASGFATLRSVASAEAALAILDTYNPELIILDVMMPGGMDGYACCEEIRTRPAFHGVPILIQTAIAEPHMRALAFQKGASDFVSKPVYPDELCARVTVQLERRQTLKTLTRFKSRMDVELESARLLQHAILPSPQELLAIRGVGQLELASVFRPSSEVGGDFWGIKTLSATRHALWLVDFSGHGVAAAINAFRAQAYMKESTALDSAPDTYLTHMNMRLRQLLLPGQFATMFYGVIDTEAAELRFACACAPHPMVLRGDTGQVEQLDGSGLPLGISPREYPLHTVAFRPGDSLFLYSDALTETPDATGDCLSEAALQQQLGAVNGHSAQAMLESVLGDFTARSAAPLADDLTIIVCKQLKEG